jgi:hypothetical protein
MYRVMHNNTTRCFTFDEKKFVVEDLHAADNNESFIDELFFLPG